MSVENKLILKLLESKDWDVVVDKGITQNYFTGSNKRAFKWISNFKLNYGTLPDLDTFKKHFPEVNLLVDARECTAYYCDEVRKKIRQNKLVSVLEGAADKINAGNVDSVYTDLTKLLMEVNTEFTFAEKVDIGRQTEERFKEYELNKITGGMTGIPLGILPIDKQTGGVKDMDLYTFLARSGTGKALTLSTPILTKGGWKPMGDIKVGEQVFSRDGKCYAVTAVYPQGKKQVYRVHFVDGTFVDCCKDHLWTCNTMYRASKGYADYKTYTTQDLYENTYFKLQDSKGCHKVFIPVTKAIEFEKGELPLDPYVLGLLLGDGYLDCLNSTITFTNTESDLVERLREKLKGIVNVLDCPWNPIQFRLVRNEGDRFNSLKQILKSLGLFGTKSRTKFIPKDYLYSSVEDRRALLAGLIDTDGYITQRGATSFTTISKQLFEDVTELVRGLGYRVYRNVFDRTKEGKGIEYHIHISSKEHLATSEKHLNNYTKGVASKKHFDRLYIDYIEKLPYEEEMQCITVDSPDHTFICKDYIVTHNTWMLCILAANLIKAGYKVMLLTKEMSPKQLLKRMDAIMACVSYNALKNGKLPANEEAQYKTYLEQYAPKYKDKLSIELVTNGVDEAISKIDNFQPDIALVDGGYLLSEGADPEDWKAVIGVWKAFKVFALSRKIPVILTSQLTDKNTVAYSTGLKQYCDGIWAMKQDDVQRAAKEIQIENIKIRDGEHLLPFTMSWDFSSSPMNYEVVHQAYNSETNKGFLVKDEPISLKKVE